MKPAALARGGLSISVTAILVLAGCSSPDSESRGGTPSPATSSPEVTTAPTPTPTEEQLELTFGAAEDLVGEEWQIAWADPFITDEGFAVLAPDDGNGSWSYTDIGSGCEIHFYQGQVLDLDWSQDDRAVSDEMLAILAMVTPTPEDAANVSANAGDLSLDLESDQGYVDLRAIGGAFPDGRSVVQAARMFGAQDGGITVSLVCPPGQDATGEFNRLTASHLRVVVMT